ncbi:hypothetical protein [Novosphingobium sp.]|uniref:hypothetical protein n=1 Tax=Novosphingobium sp. TaxID=1874826 RepID=UPI0038B7FB9E
MSGPQRNWALLTGAVLALFGGAWLFGALHHDSAMRGILYARSAVPAAQLEHCFAGRLPKDGGARVLVHDLGKARRVDLMTAGRRPMSGAEAAALKACLGGAV